MNSPILDFTTLGDNNTSLNEPTFWLDGTDDSFLSSLHEPQAMHDLVDWGNFELPQTQSDHATVCAQQVPALEQFVNTVSASRPSTPGPTLAKENPAPPQIAADFSIASAAAYYQSQLYNPDLKISEKGLNESEGAHSTSWAGASTPSLSHQGSASSLNSLYSNASTNSRRGSRIPGFYRCNQCFQSFDVPSDLRHHERNHLAKEDRPHACADCEERFLYPKDLARHTLRKHPVSLHDKPEQSGLGIKKRETNESETGSIGLKPVTDLTPRRTCCSAVERRLRHRKASELFHKRRSEYIEALEALIVEQKGTIAENYGTIADLQRRYNDAISENRLLCEVFSVDELGSNTAAPPKHRTKFWLQSIRSLYMQAKNVPPTDLQQYIQHLDGLELGLEGLEIQ